MPDLSKLRSDQISVLARTNRYTIWRAQVSSLREAATIGWLSELDYVQAGDGIIVTASHGQVALMSVSENHELERAISVTQLGSASASSSYRAQHAAA